jgi:predicted DNA-binding protein
MPKPKNDKPAGGRRNVPLFITLPPEELARVKAFAAKVGRPLSWAVRAGLRAYLDTVEADAGRLERLRADVQAPKVDPRKTGKTEQPKRGRPRNKGFGLPPAELEAALAELGKLDPADLQAVVDKLTEGKG